MLLIVDSPSSVPIPGWRLVGQTSSASSESSIRSYKGTQGRILWPEKHHRMELGKIACTDQARNNIGAGAFGWAILNLRRDR